MLDFSAQLVMIAQICLALLLGGLLGFERESAEQNAGIRTYAAVCVGSCLFGILSIHVPVLGAANAIHNPSRIAAQVVTGVGFLGGGVMFREGAGTRGLTTAASLWASAAIGLAISFRLYFVAIICTLLLLMMLFLSKTRLWQLMSPKYKK